MSYLVYKIYCKNTSITDVYIGSTKDFNKRKIIHKSRCYNENKREYNMKLYTFIRNNGGFDNWEFEIIEENIQDKVQALVREKYYIEFFGSSLNCITPFRTEEEIKEYNKEHNKKYREKNKEKINEKITCDICGSFVSRSHIARHKKTNKCINSNK